MRVCVLPRYTKSAAVTVLVAVAWFWPARSEASCGDYVTVQSSQEEHGSTPNTPPIPSSDERTPPRPVCHGLQCSSPAMPTTTSPPAPEREDVPAFLVGSGQRAEPERVFYVAAFDRQVPAGDPDSIFHPPRT